MSAAEVDAAARAPARKATGELKAPTGALNAALSRHESPAAGVAPARRDFTARLAELIILLSAILGAWVWASAST
jgi:hypothetical protein